MYRVLADRWYIRGAEQLVASKRIHNGTNRTLTDFPEKELALRDKLVAECFYSPNCLEEAQAVEKLPWYSLSAQIGYQTRRVWGV